MGRIHHYRKVVVVLLLALAGNMTSFAQDTTENGIRKGRLTGVAITAGALYAGSIAGLYQLWYKDYPQSSFHFFNDCGQWYCMDKIGHFTSSYWVGRIGYESLAWSGVPEKKAVWYGGTWGLIYLTTVEIFDGFSAEWGASPCDMLANTAGAAMFIGQQLGWKEQRFTMKFSFHATEYAQYRPDLLGSTPVSRALKDYNGQTYWLSGNIRSFLRKSSRFPWWINISLGYSAEGMLGATENPPEHEGNPLPEFRRYPQFFLSLDFDPTRIRTRSETLKLLLNLIGYIKLPFPALEINPYFAKFHWLYF